MHEPTPPQAVDFSRSSCSWLLSEQPSHGSFDLDSVMNVQGATGTTAYVLSAQVAAGNVYGSGSLFRRPPYGFSIALSNAGYRIFRDAWHDPRAEDSIGTCADRFKATGISVERSCATEISPEELLEGAANSVPKLSARVQLPSHEGVEELTLEFPVRHINLNPKIRRWQIETGPVLLAIHGQGGILTRLRRAWATFGSTDRIEFLYDRSRPFDEHPWATSAEYEGTITLLRCRT